MKRFFSTLVFMCTIALSSFAFSPPDLTPKDLQPFAKAWTVYNDFQIVVKENYNASEYKAKLAVLKENALNEVRVLKNKYGGGHSLIKELEKFGKRYLPWCEQNCLNMGTICVKSCPIQDCPLCCDNCLFSQMACLVGCMVVPDELSRSSLHKPPLINYNI